MRRSGKMQNADEQLFLAHVVNRLSNHNSNLTDSANL